MSLFRQDFGYRLLNGNGLENGFEYVKLMAKLKRSLSLFRLSGCR